MKIKGQKPDINGKSFAQKRANRSKSFDLSVFV
jgi:hypothetical protein